MLLIAVSFPITVDLVLEYVNLSPESTHITENVSNIQYLIKDGLFRPRTDKYVNLNLNHMVTLINA